MVSCGVHGLSLTSIGFCETGLHGARITRHAVTEDQIEDCGHRIAGCTGNWGRPFGIDARHFDRAQEIEYADNEDQRGVLEQADISVHDVWYRHFERLRQDD